MENLIPFIVGGMVLLIFLVTGILVYRAIQNQYQAGSRAAIRQAEFKARAQQAVWAGATIISARHHTAAQEMRQKVKVDLRLQVQPPQGEPFQARTSWHVDVSLLAQFQPGQQLSVKIDREDPTRIYPNISGAEYWAS